MKNYPLGKELHILSIFSGMLSEMDISPFKLRRTYKSPTTDGDNPPPPVPILSMLGKKVFTYFILP